MTIEELISAVPVITDLGLGGGLLIALWAFYTDRIRSQKNVDKEIAAKDVLIEISQKREEETNKRYDALLNLALSSSEMAKRAAGIAESRIQS